MRGLLSVLLLATNACVFSVPAPLDGGRVSCGADAPCADGQRCVVAADGGDGRCFAATTPCLDGGEPARFFDDGAPCGDGGGICVGRLCVEPRCGDGVVTTARGERCDDGADNSDTTPGSCRSDCAPARCGDGVVDDREACDDANTASGDGCRGDCGKVEVCGDGIVDDGEACDDGNDNPRDGCASCVRQVWSTTVVVSGAVETRQAVDTPFNSLFGVAVDPLGRIVVVDLFNSRVRRIDPDGTIATIAGSGDIGFSGDGGPATSAALLYPRAVAVDALGRVFVADTENDRVRRVDPDGTITTVAGGNGADGLLGDDGPATSATLKFPTGLTVDVFGRIFVADTGNNRIRRIDPDGTITTIAGNGALDSTGDGGPATSAAVGQPQGVAVDDLGRVVIAETRNNRVRRVEVDGTITTIAGDGTAGFSGDGGPATTAALNHPQGVVVDPRGQLFVADSANNRVRRVDSDGTITTAAGTGAAGFSGDLGPATRAALNDPTGLAVDPLGRLVVVDAGNLRVRRIDATGTIETVAGTGAYGSFGDGGAATSAALNLPSGIAVDPIGRIVLADTFNDRVRSVDVDGTITTVAGTGITGVAGDGGPATDGAVASPSAVAVDRVGRVLIATPSDSRIRRVELDGTITTVAGRGTAGFAGDGGPATIAALSRPLGVAVDDRGNILIADTGNRRIRRVDAEGTVTTIAGGGAVADDGVPATSAGLSSVFGLAVDAQGRILICDTGNNRIRRVDVDGTIATVAGNGARDFAGDGGPATAAALAGPEGVAVDATGRIVIADTRNNRIRRVDLDGTIATIAGTGDFGAAGDGGDAVAATLSSPKGIAVDPLGRIVVVDSDNSLVRRVELDGTITTFAGAVHPPGQGAFERAALFAPAALARLPTGALVSVGGFGRALRVAFDDSAGIVDVVVGYEQAAASASSLARFAPLLDDARGVAFEPARNTLVIAEHDAGTLRVIGLDPDGDGVIDAPATWTSTTLATTLAGPAGILYDAAHDDFVVVDEADHCVVRVDHDGNVVDEVFGRCGTPGIFPGFLNDPTHAALSPASGALYVADTGNGRVLRVDTNGSVDVVIGDGSVSSAGEGSPARLFPVHAPRQLALDDFGNLFIASTTTVRLVLNVDGDVDADGDDRVVTIFGGGARDSFPASDTFCLNALTLGDDGDLYAADACQGFLVRLAPRTVP